MILVRNPTSRSGRGRRLWHAWEQALHAANQPFQILETDGQTDVARIAAVAAGETVVAVGGDGTINAVLQGARRGGAAAVGVLYAGTSPDFCAFHGIPRDPETAVATLLARPTRQVDLLQIEQDGTSFWAGCSCSVGIGAATARFANRWRRYLGDFAGTLLGVLTALLRHRPETLRLTVDGVEHYHAMVNHLFICKNPQIASGLRLGLDLRPTDGRMVAVLIAGRSFWGMMRLLPALYRGTLATCAGVTFYPCQTISVNGPPAWEVEYDGDPHGHLPLRVSVDPQALTIITPAQA